MVLSLVFVRSCNLDGRLYTIVKLIWKLIQSRIAPTLVLVDIFWLREQYLQTVPVHKATTGILVIADCFFCLVCRR